MSFMYNIHQIVNHQCLFKYTHRGQLSLSGDQLNQFYICPCFHYDDMLWKLWAHFLNAFECVLCKMEHVCIHWGIWGAWDTSQQKWEYFPFVVSYSTYAIHLCYSQLCSWGVHLSWDMHLILKVPLVLDFQLTILSLWSEYC